MSITTVTGEINKAELGITLPHEHLLIDLRNLVSKPEKKDNPLFYQKLNIKNRYAVYSDPYAVLDNAVISDFSVALYEVQSFIKSKGKSIVDVTLKDIGRNPALLKKLSVKSGVNIIMGCGYYVGSSFDETISNKTEKNITEEILNDIYEGAQGTDIKAGVIGEIGTSEIITPDEWKVVKAAGNAAKISGKGIHIHTSLWGTNGLKISQLLKKIYVKPEKIAINHIDVDIKEDYILKLLDEGVFIEFDNFGKEFYMPARETGLIKGKFAYDFERAKFIKKLIEKGYEKQLLITNDICLKSMLVSYGGNGYGHIINNIIPMLKDIGVNERSIQQIIIDNPANFLD